jgi:hypothetical protein
MKRALSKINDLLTAAALAETGLDRTVRAIPGNDGDRRLAGQWEALFTAITFAEAGEFETARRIMHEAERKRRFAGYAELPDDCRFGDNEACFET